MLELLQYVLGQENILNALFIILGTWFVMTTAKREQLLNNQITQGHDRESKLQEIVFTNNSIIKNELQEIRNVLQMRDGVTNEQK